MRTMLLRAAAALFAAIVFAGGALAQSKSVAWQQIVVVPNSSAYSAGQCVGGVLTVPNMIQPQGPGGTVLGAISMVDPQAQSAANDAMTVVIFNQQPTGTYTDHANCNVAAADAPFVMGSVSITSSNCITDQAPATTFCTITPALPLGGIMPVTNPNLYFVVITRATPTYGASAKLYFNFMATPFAF